MNFLKKWFKRHRTVLLGLGSTIIMLIFLVFLADWVIMPLYTHHGAEEELPDVTELSFEKAKTILNKKGFQIIRDKEQFDDTYPAGTVIAQNPAPFSRVKKGRRIYVTVSAGERSMQVPRVLGSSERDAIFAIRQAGLKIGDVFYKYNDYYPGGVVCNQSIPPDSTVVEKTVVDITVSLGRLPGRFLVPDVVGKSLKTAKKLLGKAGLKIGSVTYKVNNKLIPDTVIEQAIAPGQEVSQGQEIDLVVSQLEED